MAPQPPQGLLFRVVCKVSPKVPAVTALLVIAVAALALTSGALLQRYLTKQDSGAELSAQTPGEVSSGGLVSAPGNFSGQNPRPLPGHRPDFHFQDQQGRQRAIAEFDGLVLVVNFWATWCPPCLHEIPVFMALQETYSARGVQFVGVALDDSENVRAFAKETGLNYPTMSGSGEAVELNRQYGNVQGGLPFTAVVDRSGRIAHTHTGPMSREQAVGLIELLIGPRLPR